MWEQTWATPFVMTVAAFVLGAACGAAIAWYANRRRAQRRAGGPELPSFRDRSTEESAASGLQLALIRRELTLARDEIDRLEAEAARLHSAGTVVDLSSEPPSRRTGDRPGRMLRSYGWLPDVDLLESTDDPDHSTEAVAGQP
jgi:hypothetical protein